MKDPCIRQLLKSTKLNKYIQDGSSKIVEELDIAAAKARIDMAVINGHLHGFEIKSASDTLQRLPSQIDAYTKVFDYLSVVTEYKYHTRILDLTPEWIGVYVCYTDNGKQKIRTVRKAKINHNKDAFYIAKLLWRNEMVEILNDKKISFRKKDRNWILCELLAKEINTPELSKIVRGKMKARINWKGDVKEDDLIA